MLRCWLKIVPGKKPRTQVAKITRHESYKEQLNGAPHWSEAKSSRDRSSSDFRFALTGGWFFWVRVLFWSSCATIYRM